MTRPDRMTEEGLIWNANKILDRLDRSAYAETTCGGDSTNMESNQLQTTVSTDRVTATKDTQDDVALIPPSQSIPTPTLHDFISTPWDWADYIKGVILVSVILPPIEDYVGRVGTGLAYYRQLPSSATNWSDPKPCSLTALVPPMNPSSSSSSSPVRLDLLFFYCDTTTTTENHPVDGDRHVHGTTATTSSWWHELSGPRGLVGAETAPLWSLSRIPDEYTEGDERRVQHDNGNGANQKDDDDKAYLLRPSNSVGNHPAWKVHNLANMIRDDSSSSSGKGSISDSPPSGSSLFYYAWEDDQLLDDTSIALERFMLREMTVVPPRETAAADQAHLLTDENRLRVRLQSLLGCDKTTTGSFSLATAAPTENGNGDSNNEGEVKSEAESVRSPTDGTGTGAGAVIEHAAPMADESVPTKQEVETPTPAAKK